MDEIRKRIVEFAEAHGDEYKDIALKIHGKPEVSNYEFFASGILSDKLKEEGFEIELPAAGHRTGFAARYDSGKPGPVMCFLAEYDALAGLGHGCGHNLFGATSSLAGAALKSVIDEVGGEVRVYGTPGEEGGENGSAKGSFVREGYFKDVDAALSAHPGVGHVLTEKSLGCAPVDIEFWGKSSHAAAAPEKGINALDALIQTYNSINALRQHLPDDVRIHGIITDGGKAPNAVPDYAAAKFYLRAATAGTLDDVYKKVERIVEASALAMGAKGSMKPYQNRVENMVPTPLFDSVYAKNLELFGYKAELPGSGSVGSTDIGNVSQVIPAIQPKINISDRDIKGHSIEFVEASCSKQGLDSIVLGAKVLALTALDLIEDPELLKKIKEEHRYMVEHQGE
ncbi:MAG: M20 family metallopeptidase [Candidatus Avilachnospira sp.]|jgi:amidohydrolase